MTDDTVDLFDAEGNRWLYSRSVSGLIGPIKPGGDAGITLKSPEMPSSEKNESRSGEMSWIQPICAECYDKRYPGREPVAFSSPMDEQCCDCGNATREGIYFRADPNTVKHPTHIREQGG